MTAPDNPYGRNTEEPQRGWAPSADETQVLGPGHFGVAGPHSGSVPMTRPPLAPAPPPPAPADGPIEQVGASEQAGPSAVPEAPSAHPAPRRTDTEPPRVEQQTRGAEPERPTRDPVPAERSRSYEPPTPAETTIAYGYQPAVRPADPRTSPPAPPSYAPPHPSGPNPAYAPPQRYAPAGPAQQGYAPPAVVPPPADVSARPAQLTSSRTAPSVIMAIVGLLLGLAGFYLIAKYGIAVLQDGSTLTDKALVAGGGALLLLALLLDAFSFWATLIPGVIIGGVGIWVALSASGRSSVADALDFAIDKNLLNSYWLVEITLVIGSTFIVGSLLGLLARSAGRRAASAEGPPSAPPVDRSAPFR